MRAPRSSLEEVLEELGDHGRQGKGAFDLHCLQRPRVVAEQREQGGSELRRSHRLFLRGWRPFGEENQQRDMPVVLAHTAMFRRGFAGG